MGEDRAVFSVSAVAVGLWGGVLGLSLGLLLDVGVFALMTPLGGELPIWPVLIVTVPLIVALAAGLAALYARMFPVSLDQSGLTGNDAWGRRATLGWADVSAARVSNVAGLRFLRVSSASRPDLWVPLFLKDRAGFASGVRAVVPAENPVRQQLDRLS